METRTLNLRVASKRTENFLRCREGRASLSKMEKRLITTFLTDDDQPILCYSPIIYAKAVLGSKVKAVVLSYKIPYLEKTIDQIISIDEPKKKPARKK